MCGTTLALACPSCGAALAGDERFCGECGTPLTAQPAAAAVVAATPAAERRLVSVLFADLVGFTTASEGRDAEETRELLSRYFETARTLIERYGGTVEKFIGDAVMAVWGTPVAQEDDAERAVRAALDLVAAVPELDANLRARAGVLTGEAAVNLAAAGEGMVAGDLVNTASRIQSTAEPGSVLVGDSTRRASEAAIAYEDAGARVIKGKAEPVQLWRALRVTAGRAGALRSAGLEPPFVGRDRELRLVKELFHATADERRAQLVTITGIAGIGKTRLSWEFEKYIDGLAQDVYWHRGRCLSYGEGVAYWALAEMVRMRCDIAEEEEAESAREKLRATVEAHIRDDDERRWVEPRLAHLLGLEDGAQGDEENLFAAWRILFERLAEDSPTVLVFEDMQWAGTGLLDFLEYLLEWARAHPIFVLVLARPELADKRPTWGAGKRSFTSLYLEPLPRQAMEDLLAGLVPGLPDELRDTILARAEGVPLYAVETVRMLVDRGLLVQEGNSYRQARAIETLDVPETLHALVAARLDGLPPEERRLVQNASVLGKTFTKQGIASLSGLDEAALEPLLASLVRKEVLAIQADPRSPERGQYAFLQDLVKQVAYETLARRDRKAKHVGAARILESSWGGDEDEIVEVVAAHYVDAYEAAPDDPDAHEIKDRACELLVRSGERAASLAAPAEARHAFARAAALAANPLVCAELLERAGVSAWAGADAEQAAADFERAIELFTEQGATHPAARVAARHADILWDRGRLEDALARMDRSFLALQEDEPDADLASLAAQLGRFKYFAGDLAGAHERIEVALDIAEAESLPETLSQALNTKALTLLGRGRVQEPLVLLRHALEVAIEHDKPSAALRAYYNLGDTLASMDQYEQAAANLTEGLALARRVGNRYWEYAILGFGYAFFALGQWDEVLGMAAELPTAADWEEARIAFGAGLNGVVSVNVHRGRVGEARQAVELLAYLESSADVQERAQYANASARLELALGNGSAALQEARAAWAAHETTLYPAHDACKEAFVTALEAALALGNLDAADEILRTVERFRPGEQRPFLQAQASRFRAALADRRGDGGETDRGYKGATALFREIGFPFYLAVTLLEHAESLRRRGDPEAEPLLAEAREIFEPLEARPWLERCDAAEAPPATIAAPAT
jgi:class 3 adenylate cyclase/tetratricopeptide (TPR) repeat protein